MPNAPHDASDAALSPLRALRRARGLTQDELARRTGLNRKTVIRLEHGRTKPLPGTALLIAAALGCRPGDLLEDPDA